ncbi:NUDIX domain-containing protein [Lysobacter hankyongensis]|uniref:Nudix hydrolase domain-containing protein n=1 Tax=Lysobacter hankyongensis TaxID=1176535 RepID=A0ABP9BZ14_9GAMM
MAKKKVVKSEPKSDRQLKAERLAVKIREAMPRPIVIEFAGLPKAGKSSTLTNVQMFLKRCGFKTEVVVERASVCPIKDKKHAHFNAWTACTTLSQVLEKTQDPPREDDAQILFLDRGLFDAICWFRVMERLRRVKPEDREQIEKFLRIDDWREKITGVILMTASPEDALRREVGLLDFVGTPGSIMNAQVLDQLRTIYDKAADDLSSNFEIVRIDTSAPQLDSPRQSAEYALDRVLEMIEFALEERILFLPTSSVERVFGSSKAVGLESARQLAKNFESSGIYKARIEVEPDVTAVQALPIVVVRNKTGDVLVLLRREPNPKNPLHEKVVIWAGGHAREEDGPINALAECASRELYEELRVSVDAKELTLLGAIYDRSNDRSARHAAMVYEWRAPSDDVAIALSSDEFFERHGTSLTGNFVTLQDLSQRIEAGEINESWSISVADFLLSHSGVRSGDRLI